MTGDSKAPSTTAEPATAHRWLRIETALAIGGALIIGGFMLPWFKPSPADGYNSGLELALDGGVWTGLLAIPALGAVTALLGFVGWRIARYAALATVIAVLVPAAATLAGHWPWLYTIPVAAGFALIGLGVLGRGLRASPLVGVALVGGVALAMWLVNGEPVLPDVEPRRRLFGLVLPAALPLLVLFVVTAAAGVGLLVTGLRKTRRARALLVAGSCVIGLGAYAAALDGLGGALATSSIGAWMTGTALLLLSLPLASAATKTRGATPARAKKTEKTKAKAPAKATPAEAPPAKATAATAAADVPAKKAAATSAGESGASAEPSGDAEKAAKLEKLKKLKKLKLLRARELAATKEAEAAEDEEKATAKAGEALASEPEPAFASDPDAPPPPKDEDRDALMRRVGVKKPPPPTDSDLEAMLAALKARSDDDE